MIDLEPAARRLAALLAAVSDDEVGLPTPCPDTSVGDLADHLSMFAVGFVASAGKQARERREPPPRPSADHLEPGWRERVGAELVALARAWQDPGAWEGVSRAGAVELPASTVGLVAVDELVVHGWDLARATGRSCDPAPAEVEAALGLFDAFQVARDGALFGPVVPVADDAPAFERLLGLAGRDPDWRPPRLPTS